MNPHARWLAVFLIVVGVFVVFQGLFVVAVDLHNGFYDCGYAKGPAGSQPYEAAYNSHYEGIFPIGLNCVWNMKDGSTSTTFRGDWSATILTYGGLGAIVGGIALVRATSRSRTRGTSVG